MSFHSRLKSCRESQGFSQIEFAQKLGVSNTVLSRYESGDREPNFEMLIKIAKTLNVSIDHLICGEPFEQYSTFENNLKSLRKSKDLTQKQLAEKINVTHVSISGYESGNRTPDLDTLKVIADYFDVSIDYLLGRHSKFNKLNMSNSKLTDFYDEMLQAEDELIDKIITIWNVIKK